MGAKSLRIRTAKEQEIEGKKTYRELLKIGGHRDYTKERIETLRKQVFGDFYMLNGWFRYDPKKGQVITECPVSLAQLTARVGELAKLVGKRTLRSWNREYSRVAREYRSLNVKGTIQALIERAMKHLPVPLFVGLIKIWQGGGVNAEVALRFLQTQWKLSEGLIETNSVKWADFYELFVEYRNMVSPPPSKTVENALKLLVPGLSGSCAIMAYAAALEIRLKHAEWVSRWKECADELAEWLGKCFPTMSEQIRIERTIYWYPLWSPEPSERAKFQSAIRQQRCRARKKAAKKRDADE